MNLSDTLLGKFCAVPDHYAPDLLQAVPRLEGGCPRSSFSGYDLWTIHELFWFDQTGFPQRGVGRLFIPATAEALIETKSAKLYFQSLRFHRPFSHVTVLEELVADCFSRLLNCSVFFSVSPFFYNADAPGDSGICLESFYPSLPSCSLRFIGHEKTHNRYYTNLFLTHCPVTAQPDLARAVIDYEGPACRPEELLGYLFSFRSEKNFNETCCEKIFVDLNQFFQPARLMVALFYMRRGGISLTPFRTRGKIPQQGIEKILGVSLPVVDD